MRAVLVEPRQVPLKLGLEPLLEVIAFLKKTRAPSDSLFFAYPSDQFQLTFVFCAVFAFTILFVPSSAEFFVRRPIFPLAFNAFKTVRQYGSGDGIWTLALTAIRASSAL